MQNYTLIFKALSDEIRIDILRNLYTQEEMCVCELMKIFNLPQSKLSYHLKILLECDFISKTTRGKWNYYSIKKETLEKFLNKEIINEIFNQKKSS